MTIIGKLHKKGIIHRDLKPENILLDEATDIVLIDFGFAIKKTDLKKSSSYVRVGTLDFYPYEMLVYVNEVKRSIEYDEKVDIWCMGIILYEMLYGTTPFFSKGDEV